MRLLYPISVNKIQSHVCSYLSRDESVKAEVNTIALSRNQVKNTLNTAMPVTTKPLPPKHGAGGESLDRAEPSEIAELSLNN